MSERGAIPFCLNFSSSISFLMRQHFLKVPNWTLREIPVFQQFFKISRNFKTLWFPKVSEMALLIYPTSLSHSLVSKTLSSNLPLSRFYCKSSNSSWLFSTPYPPKQYNFGDVKPPSKTNNFFWTVLWSFMKFRHMDHQLMVFHTIKIKIRTVLYMIHTFL